MAAETKVIISGENRSQQAFTQAENSLESLERQSRELAGCHTCDCTGTWIDR